MEIKNISHLQQNNNEDEIDTYSNSSDSEFKVTEQIYSSAIKKDSQTNQNNISPHYMSIMKHIPVGNYITDRKTYNPKPGLDKCHANYMYTSIISNKPLHRDKHIFKEIMGGYRNTDFIPRGISDSQRFVSIPDDTKATFCYTIQQINVIRGSHIVFMTKYLEKLPKWFQSRLKYNMQFLLKPPLFELVNWLDTALKTVAMDFMIYYHTKSEHMLYVTMIESLNLLELCKQETLFERIRHYPEEFSLKIIEWLHSPESTTNDESTKELIPDIAENLINFHNIILEDSKLNVGKNSMKQSRAKHRPIIIYFSFVIPGFLLTHLMQRKFHLLENQFHCKVMTSSEHKILEVEKKNILVEILFDYELTGGTMYHATHVMRAIGKFSYPYTIKMHRVIVALSIPRFFLCDSAENLIKRQHKLRETNPMFISVLRWISVMQLDAHIL